MTKQPTVDQVTIRVPAQTVLGGIWWSDGSGARGGVGIEDPYDQFEILAISLEADDMVRIDLQRKDDE